MEEVSKIKRYNWTEEPITVVLYEYCRLSFGQFSGTKPFIEKLGSLLHRSSGAIVRKVGNLAHFDPQMKASHIIAWSKDEGNRTNPQNGFCLNVLLHKAYDDIFLGNLPDYDMFISDRFFGEHLKDVDERTVDYIRSIDHRKLILPHRFYPDRDFIAMQFENFEKR